MMMRLLSKYWLLVPLLLIAIVTRDWVEDAPDTVVNEDTIDMRSTKSDYYLEDFTTRKFDQSGSIEYEIQGNTLAHFPDDDRSEISQPQVKMHRADVQWTIDSDLGRLDRSPDVFTLQGDVVVVRSREGREPVTIRTSDLAIHTDSNEVRTEQPVEIVSEAWQLRSVGLLSKLDAGKLNLLSEVTGHYEITVAD